MFEHLFGCSNIFRAAPNTRFRVTRVVRTLFFVFEHFFGCSDTFFWCSNTSLRCSNNFFALFEHFL